MSRGKAQQTIPMWIGTKEAAAMAARVGVPAKDPRSVIAAAKEGWFRFVGGGGQAFRVEKHGFEAWLAKGGPRKSKSKRGRSAVPMRRGGGRRLPDRVPDYLGGQA